MLLDWLADGYPRFPEFQRLLRDYECGLAAGSGASGAVGALNRATLSRWSNQERLLSSEPQAPERRLEVLDVTPDRVVYRFVRR